MAMCEAIDKLFDTIDSDSNSSISKPEMDAAFRMFDTDGNGAISGDEWVRECSSLLKASEQQAKNAFAKLKKDANGEICVDSFYQMFQDMDCDGDGSITKGEFQNYWKQLLS